MMEISVVIATRNRSEALETISLPSLAKQDFKNFEVIIWDASDDDKSKVVVETFIQSHPDMMIRYFKAPRVGSASQRNDAVKVANGEIIFFIDDDSEVSQDGIFSLNEAFEDESVFGVGLPLKNLKNNKEKNFSFRSKISKIYSIIFSLQHEGKNRKVMLSGCNIWPSWGHEKFGEVEWLSGCSMAYRKELFDKFSFDERLQKFGGYALAEDVQFSHQILRNKKKLIITEKGFIIHHEAMGERLENEKVFSARIYNRFIVWKTSIFPYNRFSAIVYLWSLIGELSKFYLMGIIRGDKRRLKGTSIGLKAIFDEIARGR